MAYEILVAVAITIGLYSHFGRFWGGPTTTLVFIYEISSTTQVQHLPPSIQ